MKPPQREFYPFDLYFLILLTCFICSCIILCPWVAHGTKIITSSVHNICPVYVSFFQALAHYIYIFKIRNLSQRKFIQNIALWYSCSTFRPVIRFKAAPCHPGGRNRWLLCACSRWVRPPLYNATVRYTVPSNSLKQQKSIIRSLFFHTYRSNV